MIERHLDIIYTKPSAQRLAYHLDGEIDEPSCYRELVQTLESLGPEDELTIYINCVGGFLDSTVMLINCIRNSQGHVHTILNGEACSGGGLVFLAGHSCEVWDHATFMAHTSNGGGGRQKLSDRLSSSEFMGKHLSKLYHDVYRGFMTKEEIDQMLLGHDFWMDSEELDTRLRKRAEMFQQEHTDQMKQSQQESLDEDIFEDVPDWVYSKLSKPQLIQFAKGESIITDWDDDTKKFTFMSLEEYENSLTAEQE